MIFGKYINRYYLKNAPALLLGLLSLLIVDIAQLMIPELYRLVINGVNLGKVVVDGQTLTFTREVLFQNIWSAHDLDCFDDGDRALFMAGMLFRFRSVCTGRSAGANV